MEQGDRCGGGTVRGCPGLVWRWAEDLGQPAVFVAPDVVFVDRVRWHRLTAVERRVLVAHEVGHYLLYRRYGAGLARWPGRRLERAAEAAGQRWLVSDAQVARDLGRTLRVQVLAAWWRVPWEWALRRVQLYASEHGTPAGWREHHEDGLRGA